MPPFKETTIGLALRDTVDKLPDNLALIYPQLGINLNYHEFYHKCCSVAKGFMALGVQRGEHVSVWTTNLPEWVYMQFGLGMIGAVLVTVNTNYRTHELEYLLRQSDSTTLVLMEEYRDNNFYETVRSLVYGNDSASSEKAKNPDLPALKNLVYIGDRAETPGMLSFTDIIAMGLEVTDGELMARQAGLDTHDVINMQYTSGTTGFPKGVMLTHYNIVNNAIMVGDVMGMKPHDKLLIHVPLFHCFGCVMSTLNCVTHGSTMVITEYFDPLQSLRAVEEEQCTAINGVPTMFIAMMNHSDFERFNMQSLRTGIMAGAPCPVETMNQVRTLMHCPEVVIAFGQTESSPVMTMTRRNDPVDLQVTTVGRLLPGIEGKIVDPENGRDLPCDTQGEIITRSPCVMKGYYKMPEATALAIDKEGWLHTGDLGTVDEKGYFKVTGRIKDMIIRGGENIYPREIEEFLLTHPDVQDVQVVGVPDLKYGEQILAAVQIKEGARVTAEDLIAFCTGKIARHKIPKHWQFVESFPMTASGKIQKYKLREGFTGKSGKESL